jgi:hypothetical protein
MPNLLGVTFQIRSFLSALLPNDKPKSRILSLHFTVNENPLEGALVTVEGRNGTDIHYYTFA